MANEQELTVSEKNAIKFVVCAAMYFFGFWALGADFWKAIFIAVSIFIVMLVNISRRPFMIGAIFIMWAAIGVSLSIIPAPANWRSAISGISISNWR